MKTKSNELNEFNNKVADKTTNAILTLLAFISLNSCVTPHYYYMPNSQNVPLFREKGEVRALAVTGAGDFSTSTEIQTACAITNKIGVMANYMKKKSGNVQTRDGASGKYIEGAVGLFKPLDKHVVLEIYGGMGSGRQHDEYSDYDKIYLGYSNQRFNKFFLQPSIGFTSKAFDIAFSTRVCKLFFTAIENKINTFNHHGSASEYSFDLNKLARNKESNLFESALTLRGGWKYVKVQLQLVYSGSDQMQDYLYEHFNMNLGLYIAIAKRYCTANSAKIN